MRNRNAVIITRYNEDLTWAARLGATYDLFIYNKGNPVYNACCITTENVGREAHTVFYHIINQYYDLNDYNYFLQGNPENEGTSIHHIFEFLLKQAPFFYLSRVKYRFKPLGNYAQEYGLDIKGLFQFIGFELPKFIIAGNAAQFCVSKEIILRQPIQFYRTLLDYTIKHPKAPWTLEFIYHIIFGFPSDEFSSYIRLINL